MEEPSVFQFVSLNTVSLARTGCKSGLDPHLVRLEQGALCRDLLSLNVLEGRSSFLSSPRENYSLLIEEIWSLPFKRAKLMTIPLKLMAKLSSPGFK